MLAAHRDQENMLHQRHGDSKQQPKTPGPRYPKTPIRVPLNDENARTGFAGKSVLATKGKGLQQQVFKTPMGTQSRAPLGNKTTNTKARASQTVDGGKNVVKDFDKSQLKLTTVQKNKHSQPKLAPLKFQVKADEKESKEEDNETEYAPPNPEPLPYVSDVLPEGGLSFDGLKRENLFRGFYQHFHNPVDENGVSKKDRELVEEIERAAEKAAERNDKTLAEIGWNVDDMPESMRRKKTASEAEMVTKPGALPSIRTLHQRNTSTITSRRAASSLAMHLDRTETVKRPPSSIAATKRPLTSTAQLQQPRPRLKGHSRTLSVNNVAGESASRTTIGYNKGRSASSIVHHRGQSAAAPSERANKNTSLLEGFGKLDLTMTGAHKQNESKPAFTSIFEHESDDEDLPSIRIPPSLLEEDDEDVELLREI